MKHLNKVKNKKYRVYGVIGMIALVFIGVIIGYVLNGSDRINNSIMTEQQCEELAGDISYLVKTNHYNELATANKIYSENCLNRKFKKTQQQPQKSTKTTCEAIEELLERNLYDEDNPDWMAHEDNAKVYQKLADKGCEKNREKYLISSQRELDISKALKNQDDFSGQDISTCKQIESLLTKRLYDSHNSDTGAHIDNAKIYANLSERGCSENALKYKDLAKQELEIARALNDDNLYNERESVEIVETYKRLQMQQEAYRMIEKAKKLTNPAIEFIIQLEKIIEE